MNEIREQDRLSYEMKMAMNKWEMCKNKTRNNVDQVNNKMVVKTESNKQCEKSIQVKRKMSREIANVDVKVNKRRNRWNGNITSECSSTPAEFDNNEKEDMSVNMINRERS